jgi:nucleoside-diphosphate-sugar epimerase
VIHSTNAFLFAHLDDQISIENIELDVWAATPVNLVDGAEVGSDNGFKCDFTPDVRQNYADSWPDSMDGSVAKEEWNWSPEFDLDAMVKAMLEGMSKKQ